MLINYFYCGIVIYMLLYSCRNSDDMWKSGGEFKMENLENKKEKILKSIALDNINISSLEINYLVNKKKKNKIENNLKEKMNNLMDFIENEYKKQLDLEIKLVSKTFYIIIVFTTVLCIVSMSLLSMFNVGLMGSLIISPLIFSIPVLYYEAKRKKRNKYLNNIHEEFLIEKKNKEEEIEKLKEKIDKIIVEINEIEKEINYLKSKTKLNNYYIKQINLYEENKQLKYIKIEKYNLEPEKKLVLKSFPHN